MNESVRLYSTSLGMQSLLTWLDDEAIEDLYPQDGSEVGMRPSQVAAKRIREFSDQVHELIEKMRHHSRTPSIECAEEALTCAQIELGQLDGPCPLTVFEECGNDKAVIELANDRHKRVVTNAGIGLRQATAKLTAEATRGLYEQRDGIHRETRVEPGKLILKLTDRDNTTEVAKLDPADIEILQAMIELGATSSDTRRPTDDIARRIDKYRTGESIKQRSSKLRAAGLIDSKTGRGGGLWLLKYGIETVNKQ